MKYFKSLIIASILSTCLILMNGCSSDENKSKDTDIIVPSSIQEIIKKSQSIRDDYKKVKNKLLNNKDLSAEENETIVYYIEGEFYQSFDNYVIEVNDIFDRYYKISTSIMLDLLALPLTVDLNSKVSSDETYTWILDKLIIVDTYINDYDHDSFDYKHLVSKSAEIKRVIYYRKGDKENESKYKKIVDEYKYIYG